MPKSKHRKHTHGATRHKAIRNRLKGGLAAQVRHVISNEAKKAEALQVADAEAHLPDRERGMYPKYQVARLDGGTNPGGKHEKCRKFVLDIDHDPHAVPALFSYATSARADGYEKLAGELFAEIKPYMEQLEAHAKANIMDAIKEDGAYAAMTDDEVKQQVSAMLVEGDDLPPGADAARLVEELVVRFDKVTAKPKRTRKKKDDTATVDKGKEKAA